MHWIQISACLIALVIQIVHCIPLEAPGDWDLSFFDEPSSQARLSNASSMHDFAQELGISEDFLKQLKANWEKAVVDEKVKGKERQEGGVGDFFGLGGGANGNFGGGGGGAEDDEDDGDDAMMPLGPGAAGVLTGLLGIFSGLGTLNPQRVIQSTVNFFPPHQRPAAQMALNSAFGIHNATTTTLAPLTDAPPRNGTIRPGSAVQLINSTTPKSLARKNHGVATTLSPNEEETTRKKLVLKETSLLDDFNEATIKLTPVVVIDPEEGKLDKEGGISTLEQDFASAGDILSAKKPVKEITSFGVNSSTASIETTTAISEVIEVVQVVVPQGNQTEVEIVEIVEAIPITSTTTEFVSTDVIETSVTDGNEGGKVVEELVEVVEAGQTPKPVIPIVVVVRATK